MSHCIRHYEEPMEATCRTCGRAFCGRCLVYAFGPKKPPFCVGCALTASGVRNKKTPVPVAAAPVDRKAERAERRAEKEAAKAERRALKAAAKNDGIAPDPRTTTVPVPANLSTPSSRFSRNRTGQAVS